MLFLIQYYFLMCVGFAAISAERCSSSQYCSDSDAHCVNRKCECNSGYDSLEVGSTLICTEQYSSSVAVVVPIVVVTLISIVIAIVIWYMLRRRRLSRSALTRAWVQNNQAGAGVSPMVMTYPAQQYQPVNAGAGYPLQQFQSAPSGGNVTQQQQLVPTGSYQTQSVPPVGYPSSQQQHVPPGGYPQQQNPGLPNPGFVNPELIHEGKN